MPAKFQIQISVLNLIAFLAVLGAIVALAVSGRVTNLDIAIMTGLIGVLGSFRPWSASGGDPQGMKEAVADGSEKGSKEGVSEGLNQQAWGGQAPAYRPPPPPPPPYDRVDRGRFETIEPIVAPLHPGTPATPMPGATTVDAETAALIAVDPANVPIMPEDE